MNVQERVRQFTARHARRDGPAARRDDRRHARRRSGSRSAGDGGETLLRRRAEALDALQDIVNTAFRRELDDDRSFVVDCLDYRKGKDAELKQMARFMMEKVKTDRAPQEMGPLNPYARRLVHLTVAEDPAMSSESIGDAFLKTVIISPKR